MTSSTYNTMLKFEPGRLNDIFCEEFIKEYGENKLKEIVYKIEDSEKVNYYLNQILNENIKPSPQGLGTLLNSITYFIFSKAETLCMGGLAIMTLWKAKAIDDQYNDIFTKDEIVEICADYIILCSKLKMFKSNNTFQHFFNRIDQIGREIN